MYLILRFAFVVALFFIRNGKWLLKLVPAAIAIVALLLSYPLLSQVVAPGLNLYLVLMAAPFAAYVVNDGQRPVRFGWFALPGLLLYSLMQVQSLYFMGLGLYLLFLAERTWGKLSRIPFFLLLLLSPFTAYVVNIVSFPLRLKMSAMAGKLLQFTGLPTRVDGNIISFNGFDFSVDPACVGLQMITTAFILSMALLAYHQYKQKQELPLWLFGLYLLLVLALVMLSNFSRILLLVLFKAMPETLMHEVIGLLSLAVYVLLPLVLITPRLVKLNFSSPPYGHVEKKFTNKSSRLHVLALHFVCLGLIVYYSISAQEIKANQKATFPQVNTAGFEVSEAGNDVLRLKKPDQLIYVKPCRSFYNSTHSPAICWKGSGYEFTKERKMIVAGQEIITAQLTKKGRTLYTAWWYENGTGRTINQWQWRWDMLRGARGYYLVNISVAEEEELEKAVREWVN